LGRQAWQAVLGKASHRRDERVVGGDEAEAARGNLVDLKR